MNNRTLELLAVSALIGECESLTASGDLNEMQERSLRLLTAHALAAFKFQSKPERAANTNTAPIMIDPMCDFLFDPSFDEILDVLRAQMGMTL